MTRPKWTFYEFFAGGGMARAGLGSRWRCLMANDMDPGKASSYKENWGGKGFKLGDVKEIRPESLSGTADLSWASFPCQDLSLAGSGAGLGGARSGTFWPFWRLMEQLVAAGRGPRLIVLENVTGAITSHGGGDFRAIVSALASGGYRVGPLALDAADFVPQSRPRLFIPAVRKDIHVPSSLVLGGPDGYGHSRAIAKAAAGIDPDMLIWWSVPRPRQAPPQLSTLIEEEPTGVEWDSPEKTEHLLGLMTNAHREKVQQAQSKATKCGSVVGTVYRRTRPDENGVKRQRAEVRFDGIAGCLRTPSGGSSRQTIMVVSPDSVRTRLLSPREAARLMGLPDTYALPARYNDAYHLAGDGVAVPVVRHLAATILEPVLEAN